ncbi:hypothetical protein [Paraburkholderia sp. HP33-1]|uniref:hypothetical protein n=1 Tax=Paraburkholderia sp. HP33-1 TaxID=2883243 RepID=UPI001F443501|nr:hypothetical protein [Paraburkholderia sp. HP33-1]
MDQSIGLLSSKITLARVKRFWFVLLVGTLVAAFIFHRPSTSADYAGWVQAFGSIGAIFYAVSIASSQRREANQQDVMRRSSKLAAVRGITEHAVTLVGDAVIALLDRHMAERYVADYDALAFQDAFDVLQQIPMLELGTVGAVEGVTLIKGAVRTMKEYLETLRRNPTIILQDHAKVATVATDIQIQIETGRQKVGVEIVRVLNQFSPSSQIV